MDLNPLSNTSLAGSSILNPSRTATSSSNSLGVDFQSMLSSLFSSSGLSGASSASSMFDTGASGSNASMLMLPLMFAMMEKLMTKQMELLQSGKQTPKTTATTADTATTGEAPDLAQALTSSAAAAPSTTGVKELRQPAALLANQSRAQALAQNGMSTPAAMAPVSTAPITTSAGGHATPFGEPAHGPLTQGYHSRHNGLDVGIVVGTPVHSSMDGKVIYAGWSPIGYGNLVIVQNGDYQTYYAHLSKIPVTTGQTIKAGETIGLSGSTGNSTGPHLHYEIRYQGKNIDPTSLTLNKAI